MKKTNQPKETMTKTEIKLLLECVDHVIEWEEHMGRVRKIEIVKDFFGMDVPKITFLKKYNQLRKLRIKLNERKQ
jgi:hypothetical protein